MSELTREIKRAFGLVFWVAFGFVSMVLVVASLALMVMFVVGN